MNILSYFTNSGVPETGLSPTIRIRNASTGALVVTDAAMIEVGDGFYRYDFTGYDALIDYSIRSDGGASLADAERYAYAGNESYYDDVADAVWDEETAGHTTAGTFGAELTTKADLFSSAQTTETSPITGLIIVGDNDSGTWTDVYARDNNYWTIGEVVGAGLNVEFRFNLPSTDHRPGVFRVFGRYIGVPAGTHFMDLWGYNYESLSYEQLVIPFMPGGATSDVVYEHEFYERNIDRDNNNEVRIRIRHNPTTYNAAHQLFLDFVEITSILPITAEDIADAVWSKVLSGGYTAEQIILDNNESLKRTLGLMHENIYIDQPGYDINSNLISARVRIYSDSASVGTTNNVIGTYQITSDGTGRGQFANWRQVKV
jgi:hypothetical protein